MNGRGSNRGWQRGSGRGQGSRGRGQHGEVDGHKPGHDSFRGALQMVGRGRGQAYSQAVIGKTYDEPRRIFPTSLKRLDELLTKDVREIVLTLHDENYGFKALLDCIKLSYDLISAVVSVLAKAASCDSCPQSLLSVLNEALSSQLFKTHVPRYLTTAPNDKNEMMLGRVHTVIEKLASLFEALINRLPNKASEELGIAILTVNSVIAQFDASTKPIAKPTVERFKKLEELRRGRLAMYDSKMRETLSAAESAHARPPPSDFRSISIYPTQVDIHETLYPFLRQNLVIGSYNDVEHYLDVHFRLMREDFIAPLRDGLTKYLAFKERGKLNENLRLLEVKVYNNVRLVSTEVSPNDGLMFMLSFDVSKLKRINWFTSKRLLYGSLICISTDDFRTFQLGVVVKRDAKTLQDGYIYVRLVGGGLKARIASNAVYTLIESPAYFEAYSPILKGLQKLGADTMPFKQYIVKVSTELKAPKYLTQLSTYDFGPLLDSSNVEKVCRVLDRKDDNGQVVSLWPSAEDLKLDAAQYAALKTCLTKELAVVQGPPGTGKTFIGLKVVQMLLANQNVWANDLHEMAPILIVCYTNHALDQFLEGILKFTATGLVRIGGRSKSTALEQYSLTLLRRIACLEHRLAGYVYQNRKSLFCKLKDIENDIEAEMSIVKKSETRVLHEDSLESVMKEGHYVQLQWNHFDRQFHYGSSAIMNWLNLLFAAASDPADEEDVVQPNGNQFQNEATDGAHEQLEEVDDVLAEYERNRRIEDEYFYDEGDYNPRRRASRNHLKATPKIRFADDGPMVDPDGFELTSHSKRKLKRTVQQQMRNTSMMTQVEADSVRNVWQLNYNDRWRLYRHWLANLRQRQNNKVCRLQDEYEQTYKKLKEVNYEMDRAILSSAKVIGVTTTGAAKNIELLRIIGPRIVVVEEAAEVLEAHIITALSEHCQHLILIGDQQQLRPNPTVYKLAHEYKLDVSLFERLIRNGHPYERLRLQHRMRPFISRLLVPHIYKELADHPSVQVYPHVRGFVHDVYFVSHTYQETSVSDTSSRANGFEANLLLATCRHLLLQGYKPEQITILATYLGQVFQIRNMQHGTITKDVHCTAVDNFQGEENDIILLSLVRSNADGKVGFLKVDNRVCVALSRAKIGLYCFGNFEFLADNAPIWARIVDSMRREGLVGNKLQLRCDNHPETVTEVGSAKDFSSVAEGGCSLLCNFRLQCGHQCAKMCHVYDAEHTQMLCTKPCERDLCDEGHKCRKLCHMDCGKCYTLVSKVSPQCGHVNQMECHLSPETVACSSPCEKILRCGHRCMRLCGVACDDLDCQFLVLQKALCGHDVLAPCSAANMETKLLSYCKEPCTEMLPCEHLCRGNCFTCKQGRLHARCDEKCGRTLVCGHACVVACAVNCPPCQKQCDNYCSHSKCPKKCGFPCAPCLEPCDWRCEHLQCSKRCSDPCDRPPCNEACSKLLDCGHPCIGFCGEPCPAECRVCNKDVVCEVFFGTEDEDDARFVRLTDCGHIVESSGMDYYLGQSKNVEEGHQAIEMIRCPKCNTIIRRTLRYMTAVNETLNNVVAVKTKLFGEGKELHRMETNLKRTGLSKLKLHLDFCPELSDCVAHLIRETSGHLSQTDIHNLTNLVNLCSVMCHQYRMAKREKRCGPVTVRLVELASWFACLDKRCSEKQIYDFSRELQRIRCLAGLLNGADGNSLNPEYKARYDKALHHLMDLCPFDEFLESEVSKLKGQLSVTAAERIAIVQAIGLAKGHWFKCPNGHYYAIGDCGGAMQRSRCFECGAPIGGADHTLERGNTLAPEVDGASGPAYPTALMRY